jgi:hypothetical protein
MNKKDEYPADDRYNFQESRLDNPPNRSPVESQNNDNEATAAKVFGPPGAILLGIWFSLAFLSRHEQPVLTIFGMIVSFCIGVGWVLAAGRLRRWLVVESRWPERLQGLVFILISLGIPLLIIILLVQALWPHS